MCRDRWGTGGFNGFVGAGVSRPPYRIMFVVEDNLPKRKHMRYDRWDYANPWWLDSRYSANYD